MSARSNTTRSLRAAAGMIVAAATIAAPLAAITSVATAPVAHADGWRPILSVSPERAWFSPNKDHVQDKVKLSVSVREGAKVTVKVRRATDRTLVFKEEPGKLGGAGGTSHRWVWNGKNANGKVVRDGEYTATFTARASADGKVQVRSANVFVDTEYDLPRTPATSLDILYPKTTVLRDALAVTLRGKGRLASVGSGVLRVSDADGRVVRRVVASGGWRPILTAVFDGRDATDQPLPAGTYTLGFKVTDRAGNQGRSKTTTVRISDKALVEKTGTLVLPPTGTWKASEVLAGTAPAPVVAPPAPSVVSPHPCGKVVPSEVYPNAGATSYRSDETCTDSFAARGAYATGAVVLDNLTFDAAPRGGVYSTRVSMRGQPTVPGETDSATLTLGGPSFGFNGVIETPRGVPSPAVAQETVTATATETTTVPPQTHYSRPVTTQPKTVAWTVVTRGADSFDVADVTLTYTYFAPQE
ncbi:hypothetical protein [Nocardioides sp.]|uniref:hypothetical protein n=1 Tax=Nocardioides sp. TaxID=35761 RepID=UPI002D7F3C23|nr:hypothetical protein [Nocardioides sp.]